MTDKFKLSDHYGSVHKNGELYSIRFERILNHPLKKVWEALTIPEQIAQWLSSNVTEPGTKIDLRTGGKVTMQFMMAVSEGIITKLQTERLLEITWSEDNISKWELTDEGHNKCRLVFTETLPDSIIPQATSAYHAYLDFLSLVLDGNKVPDNILETWNEISAGTTAKYQTLINEL